jgi:hypothetical protein
VERTAEENGRGQPSQAEVNDSAEQLRNYLAGRDAPCPQCRYNLRNLHGSRCPECGEELVLRVNLAEPKQRLLIAGLIGLSAGAGMNGLLLVYLAIQILTRPFRLGGWNWTFLEVNAIGLVVEGTVLAAWLWQWRSIRRASLGIRVRLTILCWVLTGANILLFSLKIR